MRTILRITLLAIAVLAAGCDVVQTIQDVKNDEEFKSGGTAKMENSLSTLALSINGAFSTEGVTGAPTGQALTLIQQFGSELVRRFPEGFPERLTPYGVSISAPGRGVPLLRLYLADGRGQCDEQLQVCRVDARIEGSLIGTDGKRAWWFSEWVDVSNIDDKTWQDIYTRVIEAMAKDQVVTKD